MDEDLQHLIPTKDKIVIGIKDPQQYEVCLQLSFKLQMFDVPDLITDIVKQFFICQKGLETQKIETLEKALESVKKNVMNILKIATGLEEKILNDISNPQLLYATDLICQRNYEGEVAKNAAALVSRVKKLFQSPKS